MFKVAAPLQINGAQLEAELSDAGFPDAEVVLVDDEIEVHGAGSAPSNTLKTVVANHTPDPPAANPDDALREAISVATTLDQLKAALLGAGGRPARVAGRPAK